MNSGAEWLRIGTGDRILLGVFSPLVVAFLAGFVYGCHVWQPADVLMRVLKYILMEIFFTAALFGGLVTIWAIAQPHWAARLLQERFLKTMLFLVALGPIMVVFAFLASLK